MATKLHEKPEFVYIPADTALKKKTETNSIIDKLEVCCISPDTKFPSITIFRQFKMNTTLTMLSFYKLHLLSKINNNILSNTKKKCKCKNE